MFVKTFKNGAEKTYMVQWMHAPYEPATPNKPRKTVCKLFELKNEEPEAFSLQFSAKELPDVKYKVPVANCEIRCSKHDNFSRAVGCYLSMQKILQELAQNGYFVDRNVKDFMRKFGTEHHSAMVSALNILNQAGYMPSKQKLKPGKELYPKSEYYIY